MNAPRHDVAAEQYVLGAVLRTNGRAMGDLNLTASDFHRPTHEALWGLLEVEVAAGRPVEPLAVLHVLARTPIRGLDGAYLQELTDACLSPTNANFYAAKVAGHARLRRLQAVGATLAQLGSTADVDDVEAAVETARADLDAAVAATGGGDRLPSFAEALQAAMDRWSEPLEQVLSTGWVDLDRVFNGGLRRGHLMIIGARPAAGKSVAAAVVATQVAAGRAGVLWASLEMSRDEVMNRISANMAGVDLDVIEGHRLTDEHWRRVMAFKARSGDWPLWVDECSTTGLTRLRKYARDCARTPQGLRMILVDYLQLMTPPDARAPRHEQVAALSRGLKILAREFNVPVVALAQVNRGSTMRADKRPTMSDLRESGQIEADADEIVLLHRDDKERPGEIDFIVEKNRHGRTGTVPLAWAPHRSRIASLGSELAS